MADEEHPDPLPDCARCSHGAEWHRFDSAEIGANGVTSHMDPGAKFRCVGPGLDGCATGCPDYGGVKPWQAAA
jgi:hypothetical protein